MEWVLPETLNQFGSIQDIIFIRQEPKKYKLSDSHLALDMPILFNFEKRQVLLWLLEFQEEKYKFSIYRLLHYTTDMKELFPDALLIPTVLFTDRVKWRKDVDKELHSSFNNRTFLHFEYVKIKLFDYNARDYYNSNNPLVRILLPKMNYRPEERGRVIREAYKGLYQLTNLALFEKYTDFIDVYAEINEDERESLYNELIEHKETVMLAQYIRDKGVRQGVQQGVRQSVLENLEVRFESVPGTVAKKINSINNLAILKTLLRKSILTDSPDQFIQIMNEYSE
ncbi:hypothetical protein QUF70_21125 [Desulfobacterales bacterium HSG17]|nr:hypothetical protein [Desulfobacterales bacterium HSG17]